MPKIQGNRKSRIRTHRNRKSRMRTLRQYTKQRGGVTWEGKWTGNWIDDDGEPGSGRRRRGNSRRNGHGDGGLDEG